MKKILALILCGCFLACSAGSDFADDPAVMKFKDSKPSTQGGNLIDHGGKILPTSNTYAIWWGSQSAFPSDAQVGLDTLFSDLAGSSFLNIANQYMRGSASTSSFHVNWSDTSAPPNHSPQVSTIVTEACKMIGKNGAQPDSSGVYFVYTSNFPRLGYCAFHSNGRCNGVDIQIAYMPNVANIAGCDPGNLYGCNSYSQGTRSLANVTSHELMESISDSNLNAWFDNTGSEVADKCSWVFNSCVVLGSSSWQLQEEWSNSVSGCVQQ